MPLRSLAPLLAPSVPRAAESLPSTAQEPGSSQGGWFSIDRLPLVPDLDHSVIDWARPADPPWEPPGPAETRPVFFSSPFLQPDSCLVREEAKSGKGLQYGLGSVGLGLFRRARTCSDSDGPGLRRCLFGLGLKDFARIRRCLRQ